MATFLLIFSVILGLIVGSFLNVLILRYKSGRSVLGRSRCAACGRQLTWVDLVPVFSWIILRGRCRTCGSRISLQYPLVEITTGILFGFASLVPLSPLLFILALAIVSLLVAIAVYDIQHSIIPDVWVFLFALLSLVFASLSPPLFSTTIVFAHMIAGLILALPLALLWLFSHGQWMGLGDAKLVLAIGFLLGLGDGFIAILLAFVAGALFGVFSMMLSSQIGKSILQGALPTFALYDGRRRGVTMKSEIPFGPFLIGACLFVWLSGLYGVDIHFFDLVYGI